MRYAFIGGIYSNYHALVATLDDIARRNADRIYFLGDLGAFGPYPDRVPELLIARGVEGIQGNYEESLSTRAADCHCGYTDPRDNHYAQISYDYTFEHTSDAHKEWMGTLPREIRFTAGGRRFLLVHGSPRRINEFLWRSTSPEPFLEKLCADHDAALAQGAGAWTPRDQRRRDRTSGKRWTDERLVHHRRRARWQAGRRIRAGALRPSAAR